MSPEEKKKKAEFIGKKLEEIPEELADIAVTYHEKLIRSPGFLKKEAEEKEISKNRP